MNEKQPDNLQPSYAEMAGLIVGTAMTGVGEIVRRHDSVETHGLVDIAISGAWSDRCALVGTAIIVAYVGNGLAELVRQIRS